MNKPDTRIDHVVAPSQNDTAFFTVSEGKLITLYILSFGLYGIYWFYRNWALQQSEINKKIYPVWRAIFSIFFTHALFRRIHRHAEKLEKKHKFNANLLATLFVAAVITSNVLDRLIMNSALLENIPDSLIAISSLLVFFISVYPLVKVQATVNRINNDILGYLNYKYSPSNYALIIIGTVAWAMLLMSLLMESMGLVVAA